jgi:hypothetical protein
MNAVAHSVSYALTARKAASNGSWMSCASCNWIALTGTT